MNVPVCSKCLCTMFFDKLLACCGMSVICEIRLKRSLKLISQWQVKYWRTYLLYYEQLMLTYAKTERMFRGSCEERALPSLLYVSISDFPDAGLLFSDRLFFSFIAGFTLASFPLLPV